MPGASANGRLAEKPIRTHARKELTAVEVMSARRTSCTHAP